MDNQLYNFITDFRNIGLMLPPEMKDKVSFSKTSLSIEAMAGMNVTLLLVEQEPYSLIKLGAEGSEDLTIWIQLKQVAAYDTRIRVTIHAKIPAVAKFIGKKKIQTFADSFADALAQIPTIAFQAHNLN
ncbi:MAG: hypothetical protein R6U95_03925 [Bacteroidales bacterium]